METEISRLAAELKSLVYKLARVDPDRSGPQLLDEMSISLTALQSRSIEQERADACLIVLEHMLQMKPGDKIEVEWHGYKNEGFPPRLATVTIRQNLDEDDRTE